MKRFLLYLSSTTKIFCFYFFAQNNCRQIGWGNVAPKLFWSQVRWGTGRITLDSYSWKMTLCKYLNLGRGTRSDNKKCLETGGVSRQHLFNQAFSNEVHLPDSMRDIGGCAITATNLFSMDMIFLGKMGAGKQQEKTTAEKCENIRIFFLCKKKTESISLLLV